MAKLGPETISTNMIASGTTIIGDVTCISDIRIEGVLHGNLQTKGKLVVGATGEIKGEIRCSNSDIEGNIEGKVFVNELLALKATARLLGDIVTGRLAIEPGAIFNGHCSMHDSPLVEAKLEKNEKNK